MISIGQNPFDLCELKETRAPPFSLRSFARSLEGGGQTKDSDAKVTFRSSDEMIITAAAAASISASALPKRPSFSRERE